jgi:spore coat polysaccharide biosynthesis protein SpsF
VSVAGNGSTSAPLPHVLFRCEAGGRVGFGHLSRCLALAGALGPRATCRFDTAGCDNAARALIADAGFCAEGPMPPDAVVFDGYGFADATIAAARGLSTPPPAILVIDDFGGRTLDADLVISPGPQRRVGDWRLPDGARVLLGPDHALLAPHFRPAPPPQAVPRRLVLGFGGSDAADATSRVLPLLPPGLATDVLLGPGYRGRAAVRPGVTLHRALEPAAVARLMAGADAAITAPGVMALELLAIGRPALLFSLTPQQEEVGLALARTGLAAHGGAVAASDDPALSHAIAGFLTDHAARAAMVAAALAMDAAGGASRVAAALLDALARRAAMAQERGR